MENVSIPSFSKIHKQLPINDLQKIQVHFRAKTAKTHHFDPRQSALPKFRRDAILRFEEWKGTAGSLTSIQYQIPMKTIALAVFTLISLTILSNAAPEKPNFVIINIDDMGYADIEPFGSMLNRTPNLNRMAAEGRKLTSFYGTPVCSPSRASLMTGCYYKRVLQIPSVLFPGDKEGLNPEEVTIAELLKGAGYTTACIGKWHLGDQPQFLPRQQGFDYYLGIPYSNDMGPASDGSRSSLGDPLPKEKPNGRHHPPLPMLENETVITRVGPDEQQGTVERYTKAAVKFIREHKDESFFVYLPHNAVHFPIYPGKTWAGKSPNGIYSDWVEEVDWSVGQVLDALRELKLDSNTLVLFTSDNGGTPRASNAPLRGFKNSTWEGGMREPTIVWWPGTIPANTSSDEITGMIDVLPTFVKLGGGEVPSGRKIDGGNIWPVLAGEPGAKSPHDAYYFFHGTSLRALRSGPWKLHLGVGLPKDASEKQKSQARARDALTTELYNLTDDIGETTDVAAANPEIVKRLKAMADTMDTDIGIDKIGPGCRPMGIAENPQPLISKDGTIREGFGEK